MIKSSIKNDFYKNKNVNKSSNWIKNSFEVIYSRPIVDIETT